MKSGDLLILNMNQYRRIALIAVCGLLIWLYPIGYRAIGVQANLFSSIPIILIGLAYGMRIGMAFGFGFSAYMSLIRLLNHDPDFVLINALFLGIVATLGGGVIGMLRDQRIALRESEKSLASKVSEQTKELEKLLVDLGRSYEATLEGWARALELRDKHTEGHSHRVTDLSVEIARNLGLEGDDIQNLEYGALLHDIGKIGIPDSILNKPGPLTKEERAQINRHPNYAHELLKDISFLKNAIAIPCFHHENWDGSGYPDQLKGEEIPLIARIFSVADNWDALTSDRPYRNAWSWENARKYIAEQSGKKFDPRVVEIFLEIIEKEDEPISLE